MKTPKWHKAVTYVLLVVFSVYFLFPFLWIVLTALKTEAEVHQFPPTFFPAMPQFLNFVKAWNAQPFGLYLMNSVTITVLTTLGQLISCSLIAYGFARFQFKLKNGLFILLLATMMIPWDVTMIPLYMQFNLFGWINTLKPLVVPAFFGSAYYVFLLRQFLMNVPKELEHAAKIDGAGDFQIYWKIFVPIMKAPLTLVAVLNMLSVWNDYLGPLIFLQDRTKYTLALGLASFKGVHELQILPIMAITILMMIPPVIVFLYAQKYIVEGISGAIK
ncbi:MULTISPECIES: carbohydrate ABC transporter permease [unclassified Paenibacillus]|uniref:carbohydrate ABC transporter permease n=1 Tax=unclassified Paenibacillus TaxID=185978 RepID=UPI001C107A20|nr:MULTISPECIES: carbohydrate ABC transporter permease [unclassified Paenibacillus]MBU5442510.1 carbohydrate ABC transporter permease [Paenibacillus sp. MSJ-34]CAH0122090.1 Lactose transport system permease protein LacG [Paenibacillus sp. CECT 9249]